MAGPSQQEPIDRQLLSIPSPRSTFLHPLPATALLADRRAGCGIGPLLQLGGNSVAVYEMSLIPERVKTNPWLSTEKCHKCFFTCSNNVRYSRMAAERVSLLSETWCILNFLSRRCLANSIQARSGVAAGHGVKKQEIPANVPTKRIFDFLHVLNPCPSRVCLWLWSKIEIRAGSMIAQED